MTISAALLVCVFIQASYAVEVQCQNSVRCPCGSKGSYVTICAPANKSADVCGRLSKCESCEEGSNVCSKCPKGLSGAFCSRQKRDTQNPRFCTDPGVDVDGSRRPRLPPSRRRGFPEGSQVDYTCNQGFQLNGDRSLICLPSGRWSASRPICLFGSGSSPLVAPKQPKRQNKRKFCRDPGVDVDGTRQPAAPPSRSGFPHGSRVDYGCKRGYDLSGEPSLTCLTTSQWSASRPTCIGKTGSDDAEDDPAEAYCQNPGAISNGRVEYHPAINSRRRLSPEPTELDDPEYPVGSRLEYFCNDGYLLSGQGNLICEIYGFWSSDPPICKRDPSQMSYCPHPGEIVNGRMVYVPSLNQRKRQPARSSDEEDDEYPEGSKLQFSCDDDYMLVGVPTLTCKNSGKWSAITPICMTDPANIHYCKTPEPILNGMIWHYSPIDRRRNTPGSILDYDQEEYPEETLLVYSCEDGYRLEGFRRLTCKSTGFWSAALPTCTPDCGRSFIKTTHTVVNDSMTISGDWPWVVSLHVVENGYSEFICGGAIIDSHTVLTAAHCLVTGRPLSLRFGKHRFKNKQDDTEVLVIKSRQVIVHPKYSNVTLDSDIGLIKLSNRIRFSVRVQPICLPNTQSTARNIVVGKIGYISGWGETEMGVQPDQMMLASLPVISNTVCQDFYRLLGLSLTSNMFCAGYDDARQTVCGGDSGSPFVFYSSGTERYTVEGLVSFAVKGQCGVIGKYAAFTKVSRFIDWIRRNL